MKILLFLFLLCILSSSFSRDYSIGFSADSSLFVEAKVVKVLDGDTIVVLIGNTSNSLRLLYIDSMETSQNDRFIREIVSLRKMGKSLRKEKIIEIGNMTKNVAMEMLKDGSLILVEMSTNQDIDIYNRWLGVVFINGTNFNYYMVRNGYARTYFFKSAKTRKEKFYYTEFKKAEKMAREEKLGIWQY